jgi:hypothetical protein
LIFDSSGAVAVIYIVHLAGTQFGFLATNAQKKRITETETDWIQARQVVRRHCVKEVVSEPNYLRLVPAAPKWEQMPAQLPQGALKKKTRRTPTYDVYLINF